jgi:hypothetical protein
MSRNSKKRRDQKRRRLLERKRWSPSSQRAEERMLAKMRFGPGVMVIPSPTAVPKASDQLMHLIDPFLTPELVSDQIRLLLTLGVIAWNVALESPEQRADKILDLLKRSKEKDPEMFLIGTEMIAVLVQRKVCDPRLAGDKRLILNFDLSGPPSDLKLNVMSTFPKGL